MMPLQADGQFDPSGVLRAADDDRVRTRLQAVAGLLTATTSEQVLDGVCGSAREAGLMRLAPELDHLGFLAPIEPTASVASAAAAAGFDRDQRSFQSTILARELDGLLGRRVPTTIFKARGRPAGVPIGVEVAMPQHVDLRTVSDWIARFVGAHVALRLGDAASFDEAVRIMRREGFEAPAFMSSGPLVNEAEGIQVIYLAHPGRPSAPRLELCHYQ